MLGKDLDGLSSRNYLNLYIHIGYYGNYCSAVRVLGLDDRFRRYSWCRNYLSLTVSSTCLNLWMKQPKSKKRDSSQDMGCRRLMLCFQVEAMIWKYPSMI